jgi:hypothetical protein
VELNGGPFNGKVLLILRGSHLALTTRPKRGRQDRPPMAHYAGDSATGQLAFTGMTGTTPTHAGDRLSRVFR